VVKRTFSWRVEGAAPLEKFRQRWGHADVRHRKEYTLVKSEQNAEFCLTKPDGI
jgi:hypothetical protein